MGRLYFGLGVCVGAGVVIAARRLKLVRLLLGEEYQPGLEDSPESWRKEISENEQQTEVFLREWCDPDWRRTMGWHGEVPHLLQHESEPEPHC